MVLFGFINSASVLSSFSFSLFCVIQVFTSEMHVCVVKTVAGLRQLCIISRRLLGNKMSFNQTAERCRVTNGERTKNSDSVILQVLTR